MIRISTRSEAGGHGLVSAHSGVAWSLVAALSLITARQLLIVHHGHYPLHLLVLQLASTTLWKLFFQPRASSAVSSPTRGPGARNASPARSSKFAVHALDTLSYAVSLPLFSMALLEFESTPVLCIMSLSVFAFPVLAGIMGGGAAHTTLFRRLCILVSALTLLLFCEYRLTTEGLVYGVLAFTTFGFLQALCCLLGGNEAKRPGLTSALALLLVVVVACLAAVTAEDSHAAVLWAKELPRPVQYALAINIASTVAAINIGGHILSFDTSTDQISWLGFQQPNAVWPLLCMTGIVTVFMSHARLSITHPLQLVCCLVAGGAILDVDYRYIAERLFSRTVPSYDRLQSLATLLPHQSPFAARHPVENGLPRHDSMDELKHDHILLVHDTHISRSSRALVHITIFFWIASIFSTLTYPSPPSAAVQTARLDYDYVPTNDFDIVISSYDEPTSQLAHTVSLLTSIPSIRKRQPRLFIYTKAYRADLEAIRQAVIPYVDAPTIVLTQNHGREGETYVTHILSHWNTLANHTLFLQAAPHYPSHLADRLRHFFTPNTGMLPLGFAGQSCPCDADTCRDRHWSDSSGVVRDVFLHANARQSCEPGQDILLSYKGQFVASAARIRGTDRGVYLRLREWLIAPDSWVHREPYLAGRNDSMDAPVFGHALERLWAGLLQCNDPHIATYCPSLMAGWRPGGTERDCQCLDNMDPKFGRNATEAAERLQARFRGPKLMLEEFVPDVVTNV